MLPTLHERARLAARSFFRVTVAAAEVPFSWTCHLTFLLGGKNWQKKISAHETPSGSGAPWPEDLIPLPLRAHSFGAFGERLPRVTRATAEHDVCFVERHAPVGQFHDMIAEEPDAIRFGKRQSGSSHLTPRSRMISATSARHFDVK